MEWSYEPKIVSTENIIIKQFYEHFINNEKVSNNSNIHFNVYNPATHQKLCEIPEGGEDIVALAVNAAQTALKHWTNLSKYQRAKYLFKIADVLEKRAIEFAILETINNGKPISETKNIDLPLAINHFRYYAGWADKLNYAFPCRSLSPVGIVGQIIPWNFPLLMLAWKIAPALACGNTVILKPAETTPLTALLFTEILEEVGLPKGVVNIVLGGPKTGAAIVSHPEINKIAFTGSTQVGTIIQKSLKESDKKLTLELGGKGANIVMDDAAIDQAIEGIISGIFFNQGEVCCAGSRLLIQESIAEKFINQLKDRINKIRLGNPLDENTEIGAVSSKEQFNKILSYINDSQKEGATIYQSNKTLPEVGCFIPPTLLLNVTPDQKVSKEEIFGPVLSVLTFRTPSEAIKLANDTPYGLANGIWTSNPERLIQMKRELKAGVIWQNCYNLFDAASPFGGYKESGLGREGGRHGLLPYLILK